MNNSIKLINKIYFCPYYQILFMFYKEVEQNNKKVE